MGCVLKLAHQVPDPLHLLLRTWACLSPTLSTAPASLQPAPSPWENGSGFLVADRICFQENAMCTGV